MSTSTTCPPTLSYLSGKELSVSQIAEILIAKLHA